MVSSQDYTIVSSIGTIGDVASNLGLPSPIAAAIAQPLAGASFGAPTNILIQAAIIDADNIVTQVRFLQDGLLLGGLTHSPYSLIWSNVPTGNFSLAICAEDNTGAITYSDSVNILITNAMRQIAGTIRYYGGGPAMADVVVNCTGQPTPSVTTSLDGAFQFIVPAGGNYSITPALTADIPPSQGVTTLDLLLIRRNILGITPLDSPYKLIAADANNSGTVTTLDITLLRRLILRIENTLPAGLWRFIPSDFQFTNVSQPWFYPQSRQYNNLQNDAPGQDFMAIKVGDVNNSWIPSTTKLTGTGNVIGGKAVGLPQIKENPKTIVAIQVGSSVARPDSLIEVPITVSRFNKITSAQFTLAWDPTVLQFVGVGGFGLPDLDASGNFGHIHKDTGRLTFSWDDATGTGASVADHQVIFRAQFRVVGLNGASTVVNLSDNPTAQEICVNSVVANLVAQGGNVLVQSPDSPIQAMLPPIRTANSATLNSFSVSVSTLSGKVYTLEATDSLDPPRWQPVIRTIGTGAVLHLMDSSPIATMRFYRIRQD